MGEMNCTQHHPNNKSTIGWYEEILLKIYLDLFTEKDWNKIKININLTLQISLGLICRDIRNALFAAVLVCVCKLQILIKL